MRLCRLLWLGILLIGVMPAGLTGQNTPPPATYTDLYDFRCTPLDFTALTSTGTCNPVYPGILAQGTDGNLYGMACDYFTPCNYGSIFKMTPSGVMTILFKFDGIANSGITGSNGGVSGLTLGPDGNFYGVTPYGGTVSCGTVFRATPSGVVTTLHTFQSNDPSNPNSDGCNPVAPPVLGDDGYLYGTASNYAYKISTSGNFSVLPNRLPGVTYAPLLLASDGNFYVLASTSNPTTGVTSGTAVLQLTQSGTVTQLFRFPANSSKPYFPAGYWAIPPSASLIEGADGYLYGTNEVGGNGSYSDYQGALGDCDTYDCGTAYQISKSFSLGWVHTFNGLEGNMPYTGLIAASDGNLYGAASAGGADYGSGGTLFRIDTAGNLTRLYTFEDYSNNCGTAVFNCGRSPVSQPMQATSGLIYGVTSDGGITNHSAGTPGTGVFYRLDAALPAFVATVQPSGKAGDTIGILGQGFSNVLSVSFNGTSANFTVVSDTYVTAIVPAGASTGPVTVTFTGSSTLSSNRKFRILGSSGGPASTTTTLTSSLAPSVYGQSVTFTATVSASAGTPTGMMTFLDGGSPLGNVALSGGQAQFTISSFAAGTHSITASYGGDSNFSPSTSPAYVQIVNPAPLTITANNASKLLDAPNPAFTVTYGTFVNGDTSASLSGSMNCTSAATATSAVGSYAINCSGQSSTNYSISYLPGTLKIVYASAGTVDGAPGHQILSPISADGSSVYKQGKTVAAQFRVGDVNGASIGTPGVVNSFYLAAIVTGTATTAVQDVVDTNNPDAAFRWDATNQLWIFNITTKNLSAGSTYIYTITLNDGSTIQFQFGLR